jgi:DOPA 4,5-dioxygenase
MADPSLYTYPSPLQGYENLEPLPEYVNMKPSPHGYMHENLQIMIILTHPPSEKAEDGKSYINPPAKQKSDAYNAFVSPIDNGTRGGFEYTTHQALT